RVGSGGMGTVWVAHNLVLDVQVGIKLITFRGRKNREALALRLLDEARSAARLGHPAVIKIHDFGITDSGDPFIAMELLGGEDLASVLEREQKLPADTAVQMLLPIAHGLAAAHDKGIVHRDIKPENIFLSRDDDGEVRPKILDFGIARMIDNPSKLTLEGTPLGTPEYMSPEIARGDVAEGTSDVWSFTVVLYELLTGRCPFEAPNYNKLMQAILNSEPAPLGPEFDTELQRIVEKGLEKQPEARWASMRDMGAALARWLLGKGITEDVCGTSLRRTWQLPASSPGTTEGSIVGAVLAEAPVLVEVEGSIPPISVAPQSVPPSGRLSFTDTHEYQLAAIAEMNRGGDPVELLARAEKRRLGFLVGLVIVGCVLLVASILYGTGILHVG
ncbi:MAG TPA: serine/threonine-protein kinase, partial [Polyangiaceae bacterium]|nr:serine/threonine-protein kinase [Polyangiaceae bacterium]